MPQKYFKMFNKERYETFQFLLNSVNLLILKPFSFARRKIILGGQKKINKQFALI